MSYRILPTKEFEKDFKKFDYLSRQRIKRKMSEVAREPTRYKHLHYTLKGTCRVRIGKLRVLFSYNTLLKELYLEKIVFDHKYRLKEETQEVLLYTN